MLALKARLIDVLLCPSLCDFYYRIYPLLQLLPYNLKQVGGEAEVTFKRRLH